MHASAGSPVSYSAEAWVNASLYYKVHQKNKKFLGTMNFTTESEDYASVNYLRSVPEIGQKYYRTGGAKWRFCPNPMFCSSLDQGRVSNGSNQDNLLAAIPTYFGRWARGNLGVLINEVGQAMMGAERWSRYSALGAHWLNFAFRTTIIIIPPLFVFAKVQAIPMTDPKVFLWLMTLTFAITMGTFIYDMARRGYRPLRRGPLLNRQVFGCMICDFAALSRGNKAIWDGLHNKRPPFEVSPKMTIVPAIKKPISELKLEYTLMLASLFGAIKSGIFVWQTGNPLMMAAGFWCLYHFTMLAAAQLYMNQGVYLQHLDGHYTRKKISEGQLGVEELAGVSRRANFLNEFGRPSYDLGVDPLW
jgi:hypothetical protein